MFVPIMSFIYLFILFWVGFTVGYYFWRLISQQNLEEKLENLKYQLIQDNPVIREIETKFDENRKYLEAKGADLEYLMNNWLGQTDTIVDLQRKLAQTEDCQK